MLRALSSVPLLLVTLITAAACDDGAKPTPDPASATVNVSTGAPAKTEEAAAAATTAPTEDPAPDDSVAAADDDAAPSASAGKDKVGTDQPSAALSATATPTPDEPTGPKAGSVTVTAQADPGYKCNDAYPHKFIAAGGTNVDYPSPKTKGACAGHTGISVTVPYVPKAAGPGAVAGELKYGICDEAKTNCQVRSKNVSMPFTGS